jgi:hypothetical protein
VIVAAACIHPAIHQSFTRLTNAARLPMHCLGNIKAGPINV